MSLVQRSNTYTAGVLFCEVGVGCGGVLLGNTLKELGRLDEAEASYRQAIALKPDYAEVLQPKTP
jgi:tetratricopeptide (TPR) repeat protein